MRPRTSVDEYEMTVIDARFKKENLPIDKLYNGMISWQELSMEVQLTETYMNQDMKLEVKIKKIQEQKKTIRFNAMHSLFKSQKRK